MEVKLLDHTSLSNCVIGARTCWGSFHKGGNYTEATDLITEDDSGLLDRLVRKHKHESISEHAFAVFDIKGISRALLLELSRTRIASLSVRSTRYTLKELKDEDTFCSIECKDNLAFSTKDNEWAYWTDGKAIIQEFDRDRCSKYLVFTGDNYVDTASMIALENLRTVISSGISNDISKYALPECFKTDLVWSLNLRALRHLIDLRSSNSALWEYRLLIDEMWKVIPSEWKFLLKDVYRGSVDG